MTTERIKPLKEKWIRLWSEEWFRSHDARRSGEPHATSHVAWLRNLLVADLQELPVDRIFDDHYVIAILQAWQKTHRNLINEYRAFGGQPDNGHRSILLAKIQVMKESIEELEACFE